MHKYKLQQKLYRTASLSNTCNNNKNIIQSIGDVYLHLLLAIAEETSTQTASYLTGTASHVYCLQDIDKIPANKSLI